jgi:hypothetical protein
MSEMAARVSLGPPGKRHDAENRRQNVSSGTGTPKKRANVSRQGQLGANGQSVSAKATAREPRQQKKTCKWAECPRGEFIPARLDQEFCSAECRKKEHFDRKYLRPLDELRRALENLVADIERANVSRQGQLGANGTPGILFYSDIAASIAAARALLAKLK